MRDDSRVLATLSGSPLTTVRTSDSPERLSDVLNRAAQGNAQVVAMDSDGSTWTGTWRDLRDRAVHLAKQLSYLRSGSRRPIVLVAATEPSEILTIFWSCVVTGAEPLLVPAEFLLRNDDDTGWFASLTEGGLVEAVAHMRGSGLPVNALAARSGLGVIMLDLDLADGTKTESDLTSYVAGDENRSRVHFMTSGSTGTPKIVPQRHRGIIDMALGASAVNDLGAETVGLNWMPLAHVGGMLMAHVRDAVLGAKHVSVSTERILDDPLEWFRLVTQHHVSAVWSPNFAYRLLARIAKDIEPNTGIDLTSIRFCLNGGEAVASGDCAQFEESLGRLGLQRGTIAPAWGMAETCSGVLYNTHFDSLDRTSSTVSVGFPLPGIDVRVVATGDKDDHGVGHLEVRGTPVLEHYLIGGDFDGAIDGWFRTGDLARIDESGVQFVGRDGTRIVANGVTWNSADLEAEAEQIDGVIPGSGVVTSFRARGANHDEIAVFCAVSDKNSTVLADVKRRIETLIGASVDHTIEVAYEDIERTSIGKVRKGRLIDRFVRSAQSEALGIRWVDRRPPAVTARGSANSDERRRIVLNGAYLVHQPLAPHDAESLSKAIEFWRERLVSVEVRGRHVVVLVETLETAAERLPCSHPVGALIRAIAHEGGARSVRTIWAHPHVTQAQREEEIELDSATDCFLAPDGRKWHRALVPVSVASKEPPAPHVVLLGGTGRLGEALGAELSVRGCRVTLVGRRDQPPHAPDDRIRRLSTDIAAPWAREELLRSLSGDVDGHTQIIHLAGEPRPNREQELDRLLAPKTIGVCTAGQVAQALGASLTVLSSVNAHLAGAGVASYAAACAAAELIAAGFAEVPVSIVSVTAVEQALQTDATETALATALGMRPVGVDELATCLLARPQQQVMLGVSEQNMLVSRADNSTVKSVIDAGAEWSISGPTQVPWSPTVGTLALTLLSILDGDTVETQLTWFDLGLTSVELPSFARLAGERTRARVEVLDLMRFPSIEQLARHLDAMRMEKQYG